MAIALCAVTISMLGIVGLVRFGFTEPPIPLILADTQHEEVSWLMIPPHAAYVIWLLYRLAEVLV